MQPHKHIIPLEECLDIVLTSGLLKRRDTVSKPSSKILGSDSNSSIGGNFDQNSCSIEALDKLLAENPPEECEEEDGLQTAFSSSSSSSSGERVRSVIASAKELTDICIDCINEDQNTSYGNAIAANPVADGYCLDSAKTKDMLAANRVLSNCNVDRLRRLHANIEVLRSSMNDNL